MEKYLYAWGDGVKVKEAAPENYMPGQLASVCGMRSSNGCNLYLVEFGSGESLEISEDLLEKEY